ncbi:MAG: DUF4157 domain-containing protein, partial [Anaerolineales bacterium]
VAKANKPQQPQRKPFNPAQMLESPETMRSEDVLAAQQTVGNQVVQRALDKDDRRKGLTDNQGNLRQDLNEQIQQKRGGGTPLPENIQKEASKKLGRNFKDVRIHTDESADKLSRTISARAFTIGKDIFFKNGVFAPGSSAGRETIIHELTHVVQQGGRSSASGALKLGAPDTAHEKEADRIGKKHAASIGAAPAGAVQREGEEDELMMQQEEEEELQMQSDSDVEEMPEDAPELMMQGVEEEELQMQPDAGNVIQRKWEQDDKGNWKKVDDKESEGMGYKRTQKKVAQKAMHDPEKDTHSSLPGSHQVRKKKFKLNNELSKGKPNLNKVGFEDIEKRQQKNLEAEAESIPKEKQAQTEKAKDENTKFEKTVPGQRLKLMKTLRDPKASKEEIEGAKSKLEGLHKGAFSKKDFKAAKKERSGALEEAAKSGDDEAYEKWKSEREKTKGEKAKGFFKSAGKKMGSGLLSAGKWAGGKALGFAKGKLNEGVDHFLGTKSDDKDDDKDDAKPSVNIVNNMGGSGSPGGGGGGIGAIMEQYSEVLQENKKLKEELAGLKKTA